MLLMVEGSTFEPLIMSSDALLRNKNLICLRDIFSPPTRASGAPCPASPETGRAPADGLGRGR